MATVEKTPSRVRNVAEASRRVLDPLQRLRGYIRLYVALEAAAIVLLYILACAWLSLAFDYGAFKLPFGMSIDWVQELPWVMRLFLSVAFFYGILLLVAATAINRLMQRFRDTSLAIELERRFPKILGDRLITAIELANRRKVIEQGYSPAMVDETIVEAAQRVEKLPIKEVFRWGRLWFFGAMVLVLSVGLYFVTAAGFATAGYAAGRQGPVASFSDYNQVLSIWFERDVLLQNTIWPRNAYMVFVEPDNDNLRIGRDVAPPGLRVRAWKYIIADSRAKTREGWRLLTWNDLETKKELLGEPAAAVAPKDWNNFREVSAGLTVDEVELFFNKFDIRKGDNPTTENGKTVYHFPNGKVLPYQWAVADNSDEGWRPLPWKELSSENLHIANAMPELPSDWKPPLTPSTGYTIDEVEEANKAAGLGDINNVLVQLERLNDMRKTLDHLDARIADSSMHRKMRKLTVPGTVTVTVKGLTTTSTVTLTKMPDNEFTGQFGELKEKNAKGAWTFKYYATGDDYSTASRKITIVPPPTLQELNREDEQPAYLFYRPGSPSDAKVADIKGQKQRIVQRSVSLMGGEVVTVDCPAGTNLTLIGTTDKDLADAKFTQPKGGPEGDPEVQRDDPRHFRLTLPNVRQNRSYVLEMLDTDNVRGKRTINIRVKRDDEPSVDLAMDDWVRKTKEGYMVTAKARIPFRGNIKDDNGLSKVNYAFTVAKLESTAILDLKALCAASNLVGQMIPVTSGPLQGSIFLERSLNDFEMAKNAPAPEGKDVQYFPGKNESIPRFDRELKDVMARPEEFLPRTTILTNLTTPKPAGFRTLFNDVKRFEPDPMSFELAADPLSADFPLAQVMKQFDMDSKVQPRYRMTLWIEATDTDLDSTRGIDGLDGPKTSASKERYVLIVVPEDELQAEIAKDEAELTTTMGNALEKLNDARDKLGVLKSDLSNRKDLKAENLSPLAVRTASLDEAISSAQGSAKEVLTKYQSIFKELKGNDIRGNKIDIVLREIIAPLEDLDGSGFSSAREKMQDLHKELSGKGSLDEVVGRAETAARVADKQLQDLIDKLQSVMDRMQKQIELDKVVEKIRADLQRLQRSKEVIDRIRKLREDDLFKGS